MRAASDVTIGLVLFLGLLQTVKPESNYSTECGSPTVYSLNLTDEMIGGQQVLILTKVVGMKEPCEIFHLENDRVILSRNLTSVCRAFISCSFRCEGNNVIQQIVVTINNTKTYTPKFKYTSYKSNVSELTPSHTALTIDPPIAVSIKECTNGTDGYATFTLKDRSGYFNWKTESKANSLEIIKNDLDYERNESFVLELIYEHSFLKGSASATIDIEVLDVDDQSPIFDNDVYYLNITEENQNDVNFEKMTSPPVSAHDQDFGINATVLYSIYDQEQSELFRINTTTGLISVTEVLDREGKASYTIYIKATQEDNMFRVATAKVSITVLDIDDNPPTFDKDNYTVSVNEHVSNGTIIAVITATDPDEGDNANFTYKVANTTSIPVAIDPLFGNLIVTDSDLFDRETYENGLVVKVETVPSNYGNPGDSAYVTITLVDINDNNPSFTQQRYTFTADGADNQDIIGTFNATDEDKGPNANVTYGIVKESVSTHGCTGNSNKVPFDVDDLTGNVTMEGEMYCGLYSGLIEACDNPIKIANRRCTVASFQIHANSTTGLRNVSESMDVMENAPNGTTVGVVKCPGSLYGIADSDGLFIVEQSSGVVLTNGSLDRETTAQHTVTVTVADQGTMVCYVNVTIDLIDVNDNAPMFANSTGYVFNLKGGTEEVLGTVKANDDDEGQNAETKYTLQNTGGRRFNINDTNGDVFVADTDTELDIDVVRLTVLAEDLGIPSLKTTEYVYILPRNQPSQLIPIKSPLSQEEVEQKRSDIESALSQMTGIQMSIAPPTVSRSQRSMIQLVWSNKTLDRRYVLSAVVDNYDAIRALFMSDQQRVVSSGDDDTFGGAEIGLIALAVVVLVGAILAVILIRRQCDRARNYQHLYESLTRNSSIYESQELKVNMDDESSHINGYINTEELNSNPEGMVSAMVNPVYEADEAVEMTDIKTEFTMTDDTDIGAKSLDSSEASVVEAMESLDQLSDRLEQEEDGETIGAVVYDHVNRKSNDGDSTDNNSANSLDGEHNADNADSMNESELNSGDIDPGLDDDNEDFDDAENNLTQRILHARSGSPVMSRRNQDDDDVFEDREEQSCGELDEPNPDYDIKQVRFSTQVLDATENKIEPLKDAKGETDIVRDTDEGTDQNKQSDSEVSQDTKEDNEDNGNLMLEEDINSPVDFLPDSTHEEFYFGTADEESTHF